MSASLVTIIVWQPELLLHAPAVAPGSEAPAASAVGAPDVGTCAARWLLLSLSAAAPLGAAGAGAPLSGAAACMTHAQTIC